MVVGMSIGMVPFLYHHNELINNILSFFSNFSISDLVNVIGIFVNAYLAFWIVRNLQDKITNKRVLKDHFIDETKDLRNEFRLFLNDLNKGKIKPKEALSWFKLMNIKCTDLINIVNTKHSIPIDILYPYTQDLKLIVTELDVFKENFKKNKCIKLDDLSKSLLVQFSQDNNHIFNDLIIKINDHA